MYVNKFGGHAKFVFGFPFHGHESSWTAKCGICRYELQICAEFCLKHFLCVYSYTSKSTCIAEVWNYFWFWNIYRLTISVKIKICRTVIFPAVSYTEEMTYPRLSENRVLRKIFGPKDMEFNSGLENTA